MTCVGGVICDDQKPEVNRSCNEQPCSEEILNIFEGGADTEDLNQNIPVPSHTLSENEQIFENNNKNVLIAKSHSEYGAMKETDAPKHHKHRLHHSHLHTKKSESPDVLTNIAEDVSIKSRVATAEDNSNNPKQLEHNFTWQISAWSQVKTYSDLPQGISHHIKINYICSITYLIKEKNCCTLKLIKFIQIHYGP